MSRILIAGCSFSQPMHEHGHNPNCKWISWTDFLREEYKGKHEILNVAQSSFGQGKIAESILEACTRLHVNFKVDLAIVQWSGIGRGYSMNEDEFIKRIFRQRESFFAPYLQEYIVNGNLEEHAVTVASSIVSKSLYRASLTNMVYVKKLLQCYNIPHKMVWGWEQINDEIQKENSNLLNLLYDDDFIRFGEHGGMSEYIVQNLGEAAGILPNDFHPTTAGQELFYKNIIRPMIEKLES